MDPPLQGYLEMQIYMFLWLRLNVYIYEIKHRMDYMLLIFLPFEVVFRLSLETSNLLQLLYVRVFPICE